MRRKRAVSADDGFTIIEVVVALALIAFIMTALSPLFYSSMRTAVLTNARSQATAIATKELETMRVAPYADVAFYDDQGAQNCDPDGLETVLFGENTPSGVTPFYTPTGSVSVPGSSTVFSYEKCVAWADGEDLSGNVLAQAYKKTFVKVTWAIQGRSSSITQRSVIYPGGLGGYSGVKNVGGGAGSGSGATTPSVPISVAVTVPADPLGRSQLDVSWANGGGSVHHYVVEWATNPGFSAVVGTSGAITGTSFSATSLSSSTDYSFRVRAYGDATSAYESPNSAPVTERTLDDPGAVGCSVGSLDLITDSGSTTKTYLTDKTDLMTEEVTFASTFTSECAGGYLVKAFPEGSTSALSTEWTFPAAGLVRTSKTSWAGTAALGKGVYTFTIYNGGTSTGKEHTLLVCDYKKNPSTDTNKC